MAERLYSVYCGNYDCPNRRAGRLYPVAESDLIDGEVWLCKQCRPDPTIKDAMVGQHL